VLLIFIGTLFFQHLDDHGCVKFVPRELLELALTMGGPGVADQSPKVWRLSIAPRWLDAYRSTWRRLESGVVAELCRLNRGSQTISLPNASCAPMKSLWGLMR